MTKYRVSFEVEGYEWRDWSNGSRKELKLDSSLNKGSAGLVIVPAYAEIEEIPEPFEAGYYGAYLDGELCWVKQFSSAEDLEWSKSYMLPEQEIKPVDIIAKNASAAVEEPFTPGDYRCTDAIGYFKAGDVHWFENKPTMGFWEKI